MKVELIDETDIRKFTAILEEKLKHYPVDPGGVRMHPDVHFSYGLGMYAHYVALIVWGIRT